MAKSIAHHRSISFQGGDFFALHPQEVVLVDRNHQRTDDPWQVFREKGEKLAKVVPTRRYQVERAPHNLVVRLQDGIRIHVFYHLIGKTPEDDEYNEKQYLDHIHHIALQVAMDLGIDKRKLTTLKNNIKKAKARLKPETQQLVSDVRTVLEKILLVGTTNLTVSRGEERDHFSSEPDQRDLFEEAACDDLDDLDGPPEDFFSEGEDMTDPDFGELPLFSSLRRWEAKSVMWTPGSVAAFLPKSLHHSAESIKSSVDRTLHQFFRERLR